MNSNVYTSIWYMVASWACEITQILTQKRLLQLATITPIYFCCK